MRWPSRSRRSRPAPRRAAAASVAAVYDAWPHIGRVLPAVGYSPAQLAALEQGEAEPVIAEVKDKVLEICKRFPVYG